MGLKVEGDVNIKPTRRKHNLWRQTGIVVLFIMALLSLVYLAIAIEARLTHRSWSDTLIVRMFTERNQAREDRMRNQ